MIDFDFLDGVENAALDSVVTVLREIIAEETVFCTCKQCLMDITCMTLNNIQPKYYNSLLGAHRTPEEKENYDRQVKKVMLKSIGRVMSSPNH